VWGVGVGGGGGGGGGRAARPQGAWVHNVFRHTDAASCIAWNRKMPLAGRLLLVFKGRVAV
jgi:hypothetical protein